MNKINFSIITVSYNSAETIKDTVQSVIQQTYPKAEYLIVDGGSEDKTLDILKGFKSDIDTLISEPDKGIYHAMNKGITKAKGDVIGILNSDDLYVDEFVLRDVEKLFKNSETEAVYADLVYVNRVDTEKVKRKWVSGKYSPGDFEKGWMPPHPTFFVRKSVYNKYGLFNLDFSSAADYELMLRFIHKHNIKIDYLPRVIIKMRIGGKSNVTIKNRVLANKEDRKAWEVNGLKPGKLTFIRKPLSKIGQFLKR
jgi:glycosyltransferase involved in cell wall biosynthesis